MAVFGCMSYCLLYVHILERTRRTMHGCIWLYVVLSAVCSYTGENTEEDSTCKEVVVLEISRKLGMDVLDLEIVVNYEETCCRFEGQRKETLIYTWSVRLIAVRE